MYSGSLSRLGLSVLCCLMFMYVYHIQLERCANYHEIVNGARPTARGCHGDILTAYGGDKNGLVTSVDWKNETWVDGHSCLRLLYIRI